MWMCSLCTEGQVVQTLPEGRPVLGVTSLADEIYVLRDQARGQVEVFDVNTYILQRRLTVLNHQRFADMTSCEHCRCVYISDEYVDCIHRLDAQGKSTKWAVNDQPEGISVNSLHNLIVICPLALKIKEFATTGNIIREVQLPDEVIHPSHAIQSRAGHFIVCHGDVGDAVHSVCMVSADGRHIVHSHGGLHGSGANHYGVPAHLALDGDEYVFVADLINRRVKFLTPQLNFVRQFVSCNELMGRPVNLSFDAQRQRLYVADNKWKCIGKDLKYTEGRVVVFSV